MNKTIRDINELLPGLSSRAEQLIEECELARHPIFITETYRTGARQQELYSSSRSTPGPRLTNAQPGESWHEWRRAFDFAFSSPKPYDERHPWKKVGELGTKLGLKWGGYWRRADRPHFEIPGQVPTRVRRQVYLGALKLGARGGAVRDWQLLLRDFEPGAADGRFGPMTEAAVKRLQHTFNLPTLGFVDTETVEALEAHIEAKL